jgi:hypothetical protein
MVLLNLSIITTAWCQAKRLLLGYRLEVIGQSHYRTGPTSSLANTIAQGLTSMGLRGGKVVDSHLGLASH